MNKNKLYGRRKAIKIIGLSLIGGLGFSSYKLLSANDSNKIKKSLWTGEVLNAPVRIEIHTFNENKNKIVINALNNLITKYDNIFNLQNYKSEISLLNKKKILHDPSFELSDVIRKSKKISETSNGAFDITVQPLWDLYYQHFIVNGKKKGLAKEKISTVLKNVNWRNVVIGKNVISLENNSSITLNGIAQGYITDQVVKILKSHDIKNTLVDFGENYALGKSNNLRPWNILLQSTNNITKKISLINKAVATSSGSGTAFEPSFKHHHIFNTKTGLSANNYKTVSIVSNKAWIADAISTSCLSMSEKQISNLCKQYKSDAYFVSGSQFKKLI